MSISAGMSPENQQFVHWTSTPVVTFSAVNSASTTFTMPSSNVGVTAVFEVITCLGEMLSIYTATGAVVHHSIVTSGETDIRLYVGGVYVVSSENNTLKVLFD